MKTDQNVSALAAGGTATVEFGSFLPGALAREIMIVNTTTNAFLLTCSLSMFVNRDELTDFTGGRRLWGPRQISIAIGGNITFPVWERINRFRWVGLRIVNNDGANAFSGAIFTAVQPPYDESPSK